MKLLRICSSFPDRKIGGGLEPHVYNLTIAQKKLGYEINVLCGGNQDEEKVVNGIRIKRLRLEKPFLLKTGKKIIQEAKQYIREGKADIIHLHNPIIPLSEKFEKPLVFTIHDSVRSYKIYWKNPLRYFKSYWEFFRSSKRVALNSSAIVSVSSVGKQEAIKFLDIGKDKVFFISSGVDTKEFYPSDKKLKNIEILSVGRFVKKKGFVYLIEAFSRVSKDFPEAKLRLIGGHSGDEEYKKIKKTIKRLGLDDKVILGIAAHEEMRGYYSNCALYVQASLAEGLPKTLLEAMACGLPVIATNIDGHKDAVKDAYNGFLVDPENSDQLNEKMIYLLKNRKVGKLFGERNVRIVKERFTWDKIAQKYDLLYKKLIRV